MENFICYMDGNRSETAKGLVLFGYQNLKGAYLVQEFERLEDLVVRKEKDEIDEPAMNKEMMPFLLENLIDAVRISVFFENYMKAILISKGFLVHEIVRGKLNPDLSEDQKKRPISLLEFSTAENFNISEDQTVLSHSKLLDKTITMTTMLYKAQYVNVINLPPDVLKTIVFINEQRNKLHFAPDWTLSLSRSFLKELKGLFEFADIVFSSMLPK